MTAAPSSSALQRRFHPGRIPVVLASLLLCLALVLPAQAAEPVEIVVTGIDGEALKNVQGALVLPAELVREGKADRLWLERFAKQAEERTRSALEPFGYYHAQIKVTTEATAAGTRLLVRVVPGTALHLSRVTVTVVGSGEGESTLRRLVAAFPLKTGDILQQQRYERAKEEIKGLALDLGYLDAEYSEHEIRIDAAATTASITLLLATGGKYYFGPTLIAGAPDYPERFLRRHLSYQTGELFSYPRLGETQRNFSNSERFKTVIITPEKEKAEGYRVPVTVQLQAAPRITLRPGIGYGTDTGARFTVRYRDLNIFHLGHELYSQLYLSEHLQGLVTGYVIPSSKDVRSSTTVQLNLQQEETTTYTSRIEALEIARNRSFGARQLGTAYVRVQYEDYTVGIQRSFSRLLLPGLRFIDDRYDNPLRPRRGYRYGVEVRGTHQSLGSDTALVQILAEGSHRLPLPWRLSLYTRAKTGFTLLNDPLSDIPPSLRFFTGGDQSVRGYSYKSLGPRDPFGHVVGGKQLLVGSIELERALGRDWGVSAFYDTGNSFNSFTDVSLFQGVGLGLHYFTSVGALNLSVARPLGVANPSLHFHFTVGFEL